MYRSCCTVLLIAFVALLTPELASTQTQGETSYVASLSPERALTRTQSEGLTSKPATAAAVAYVYVQTTKGVNAYEASSTGKLTLISGSPFADTGQMEGVNGKYLISVGTDYLHTFALESNGAVGKQAAEINTQDYAGSECGNTSGNGAVLDHTGQYFYVALDSFGSIGNCAAWQSYQVLSNGDLRYLGDVLAGSFSDGWATPTTVPTISSNDLFGYGIFSSSAEGTEFNQTAIVGFTRASNGLLVTTENFSETDPAGNPAMIGGLNFTAGGWYPDLVRTDSAGHLAALLFESAPLVGPFDPPVLTSPQLASYTVGSKGGDFILQYMGADANPGDPGYYVHDYVSIGKAAGVGRQPWPADISFQRRGACYQFQHNTVANPDDRSARLG